MAEPFATQAEILDLLRSGEWELGYSIGIRSDGRYWMQEGGLMRGGNTRKVRANTLRALVRRGGDRGRN